MFSSRGQKKQKGFTLVEVIVVAVIVAVLALVGIQLYQGYATEARRNTAENLAASAASFLQTIVNYQDADAADNLKDLDHSTGSEEDSLTTWTVILGQSEDTPPVIFNCPAKSKVTKDETEGTVKAEVGGVTSTGLYRYKVKE